MYNFDTDLWYKNLHLTMLYFIYLNDCLNSQTASTMIAWSVLAQVPY